MDQSRVVIPGSPLPGIAWVRRGILQLLVVPELKDLHDQLSAVIDKYALPGTGESKKTAP